MKKKLFLVLLIAACSLVGYNASAQVHVDVGINETAYPGYTYYTYPAWHGHYRDRAYYDHYHARFAREHHAYFVHGRFDHDHWDRVHHH